ncbi:MAG: DUF5683 domain-containing protein [Candidatus Zixiibacteriota bacterium]
MRTAALAPLYTWLALALFITEPLHAASRAASPSSRSYMALDVMFVDMRLDEKSDSLGEYESWTTDTTARRKHQSPTAALFKSLLVPGLGQFGNRQYVKAGIVIGVEGILFSRWLDFRSQTADARAAFSAIPVGDPQRGVLFARFDSVRNDRNLYAWLTGTAIFLSMFDAFVDAHLRGFPATAGEISIGPIYPPRRTDPSNIAVGARFSLRF